MKYLLWTIAFSIFLSACTPDPERRTGLVNVFMIDAPIELDEVWVEVLGIELGLSASRTNEPNVTYFFFENFQADKRVNVKSLVDQNRYLVGRGELPEGRVVSMTLRLGQDNFVRHENQRFPLRFADSEAENPTIEVSFPIATEISHDLVLDFDLYRSVSGVLNPDEGFILNPVLRPFSRTNTGEIVGAIRPTQEQVVIYAIQGTDTVTTTALEPTSGRFSVRGIAGEFTLSIVPFNQTFLGDTLFNIPVEPLQSTRLEDINLRSRP